MKVTNSLSLTQTGPLGEHDGKTLDVLQRLVVNIKGHEILRYTFYVSASIFEGNVWVQRHSANVR